MKNVFSTKNAAMLLIDHQVGTIKLAVSTPYDEIVRNARALARTAVDTGMPLVLTSSQEERCPICNRLHRLPTPTVSSDLA